MLFNRWFRPRNSSRKPADARPRRFVPYLELLEKRELLSQTLVVTTVADSGTGSLRAAITQSNMDGGGDKIFFNIAGGIQTDRAAKRRAEDHGAGND